MRAIAHRLAGAALAVALAAGTVVPPSGLAAQARTGTVSGRVTDASGARPVAGALIRLVPTGRQALSDERGRFTLRDVPVGVWTLEARALGYRPYAQSDVVVGSGKAFIVDLRLEPAPLALDPLTVEASFFRRGDEIRPSSITLGGEEVRRAPGAFEDVVRSVGLLPGVGFAAGGRNDLVVRGGAPYENLFLVDGIAVPNINHFGSQGSTGGPVSLLNIDFVSDASFSSGGFEARYGDRTASVTDIALRPGSEQGISGELQLSATGVGGILEGPVGSGSFWASVRRSYLDLIFKAADFSFVPQYWDFAFKLDQTLGDDRISVLAIGAVDDVTFNDETADDRFDNRRILGPELRQYFSGVRWTRGLGAGTLSATLGRTFTRFASVQRDSLTPPGEVFRNDSREGETSLRAEWEWEPSPSIALLFGSISRFATDLSYAIGIDGELRRDEAGVPRPLAVDTSFAAFRTGWYGEIGADLGGSVRAELGLRADYYDFLSGAWRLSPRAGLSFALGTGTRLNLRAGRHVQPPSYVWLTGDPANAATLEPFRSDHLIVGLSRRLRPDLKLQIEAYHKRYGRYPARVWRPQAVLAPAGFEDATRDIPFGLEPLASEGSGRAWGAEALLQKRLSPEVPLFGVASLSVSRSEFEGLDGRTRPGAYDVRVLGTAFVGWRIDPRWEVGGRFRFSSGRPETPFITSGPEAGRLDFERYNADRLPPQHALDVRIDRRWSFSGAQLELYLDIQNVYGRRNITQRFWDPREEKASEEDAITVLPTIGVTLEF